MPGYPWAQTSCFSVSAVLATIASSIIQLFMLWVGDMVLAERFQKAKVYLPKSALEGDAGWGKEEKKEMGFHHVYCFVLFYL